MAPGGTESFVSPRWAALRAKLRKIAPPAVSDAVVDHVVNQIYPLALLAAARLSRRSHNVQIEKSGAVKVNLRDPDKSAVQLKRLLKAAMSGKGERYARAWAALKPAMCDAITKHLPGWRSIPPWERDGVSFTSDSLQFLAPRPAAAIPAIEVALAALPPAAARRARRADPHETELIDAILRMTPILMGRPNRPPRITFNAYAVKHDGPFVKVARATDTTMGTRLAPGPTAEKIVARIDAAKAQQAKISVVSQFEIRGA